MVVLSKLVYCSYSRLVGTLTPAVRGSLNGFDFQLRVTCDEGEDRLLALHLKAILPVECWDFNAGSGTVVKLAIIISLLSQVL